MRRMRPAVGAAAILVLIGAPACGGLRERAAHQRLERAADAYIGIVLALGDRDVDSLDFYAGPPERIAEAHERNLTRAEIRRSAVALAGELAADRPRAHAADEDRRQFLRRQLEAIVARVDVLAGRRFTFDEESRLLFGVAAPPVDRRPFDRVRTDLDRLLPGGGSLAQRHAAFERQFLVPRGLVPAVMARALDGCRAVTRQHLSLPAGEGVTIEYTHNMPWSAFTRYEGHAHSRIQVNTDFGLTVDGALHLACHEAYPGHHTIETLIDTAVVGPLGRRELKVQPLFSPQSLRTEGAATFAPDLAFEDADRLRFERDELFPLAHLDGRGAAAYVQIEREVDALRMLQLDVARRYLDGTLEYARAAAALENEALMPSADATLKFFNEFRSYAVTYTVGRDLVARAVNGPAAATPAARWQAYARWITSTK
jgi:hypothetical protein